MSDRRRRDIILLYSSRYDGLYLPSGSLRTQAGLAPNERRPCPDCGHQDRTGWIVDAFKRERPCTTCGGSSVPTGSGGQWIRKDGGKGFVFVDGMDSTRSAIGDSETRASARPVKTVSCDACGGDGVRYGERCGYCKGEGRRPLHAFDLQIDVRDDTGADPLDAAIDRRNEAGSYHELDLAVAGIVHHANKPLLFVALTLHASQAVRLLDEIYVPPAGRTLDQLTLFEQSLVELALAYIDSRMPDPIRVPGDVRANERIRRERKTRARGKGQATVVRDREIRELVLRERKPSQWVASEYGISVSQVNRICAGRTEAA